MVPLVIFNLTYIKESQRMKITKCKDKKDIKGGTLDRLFPFLLNRCCLRRNQLYNENLVPGPGHRAIDLGSGCHI